MLLSVPVLSLLFIASTSAASPKSPSLCGALKQAIDAGPSMAALRKGPGATPAAERSRDVGERVWEPTVQFPGAKEVRVREFDDLLEGPAYTLTALFSEKTNNLDTLRRAHGELVAQVEACLGKGWTRRQLNLAGTSAHVGFIRDRTMVDVTISQEAPDLDAAKLAEKALRTKSWVQLELHYGAWN